MINLMEILLQAFPPLADTLFIASNIRFEVAKNFFSKCFSREFKTCSFTLKPTVSKVEEFDLWMFLLISFFLGAIISKNEWWRFSLILSAFIILIATIGSTLTRKWTYLFSIDIELEDDLNNGNISDKMKKAFEVGGVPLSSNVAVIKKEANEWQITDNQGNFIVWKDEGKLKIYERKMELLDLIEKYLPHRFSDKTLLIFAVIVTLMAVFISFMTQYFQPAT